MQMSISDKKLSKSISNFYGPYVMRTLLLSGIINKKLQDVRNELHTTPKHWKIEKQYN